MVQALLGQPDPAALEGLVGQLGGLSAGSSGQLTAMLTKAMGHGLGTTPATGFDPASLPTLVHQLLGEQANGDALNAWLDEQESGGAAQVRAQFQALGV